ncbi:hypothetical protein CEUSTIGMA_g3042.t1 [Chlamydomonas eustigma]|uniref:Calcineurin-like phosphoesterase domain-containing protein n=1 Tax=Chlamydomonas eustigma TaxID=1157962 RepID=A0A250WXM2_9CHLO|nr:hypothetical protein CEUSTIGMA_g3042.t1 [Chlamydomonas eustigma]|eukprot:GAX75598.1 hypothetical protein CEUSTIGMA_g3042.t1 [Chlamydomonas eustigma]
MSSSLLSYISVAVFAITITHVVTCAQSATNDALCKCPYPVQKLGHKGVISFAVIGDWGRVGANLSTYSAAQGGYDTQGRCSNPAYGFADDDYDGGILQSYAGIAMDAACEKHPYGCEFVISVGDNFYECGLDNPIRWKTDWLDVYKTDKTPTIKNLKWYNIFGNHDIVADGSVDAQIAYNKVNPDWVANRTYAFEVHSKDKSVRIRFGAVDTSPFVTSYAKATSKYNTTEFRNTASPQNITDQLTYLTRVLSTSKATWNVVLGHHPIFGPESANGYNAEALNINDAGAYDLGRPDAAGNPSWQEMLGIIRTYQPVAYMCGHDHTMSMGFDVNKTSNGYNTAYITSGAGSLPDSPCSVAGYRTNLAYSFATSLDKINVTEACPGGIPGPNYGNPNPVLGGMVGFNIVTVTPTSFKVDYYLSALGSPVKTYTYTSKAPSGAMPDVGCEC